MYAKSQARIAALVAVALTAALAAPVTFAQSGGVDFATAATDMKTTALAALAAIGIAVLAVIAAVGAFKIGKSILRP